VWKLGRRRRIGVHPKKISRVSRSVKIIKNPKGDTSSRLNWRR